MKFTLAQLLKQFDSVPDKSSRLKKESFNDAFLIWVSEKYTCVSQGSYILK